MGDQTRQERRVPVAADECESGQVETERETHALEHVESLVGPAALPPRPAMNAGPREEEEEEREEKGRKTYISTFRLNFQPSARPGCKEMCEVEEMEKAEEKVVEEVVEEERQEGDGRESPSLQPGTTEELPSAGTHTNTHTHTHNPNTILKSVLKAQ